MRLSHKNQFDANEHFRHNQSWEIQIKIKDFLSHTDH